MTGAGRAGDPPPLPPALAAQRPPPRLSSQSLSSERTFASLGETGGQRRPGKETTHGGCLAPTRRHPRPRLCHRERRPSRRPGREAPAAGLTGKQWSRRAGASPWPPAPSLQLLPRLITGTETLHEAPVRRQPSSTAPSPQTTPTPGRHGALRDGCPCSLCPPRHPGSPCLPWGSPAAERPRPASQKPGLSPRSLPASPGQLRPPIPNARAGARRPSCRFSPGPLSVCTLSSAPPVGTRVCERRHPRGPSARGLPTRRPAARARSSATTSEQTAEPPSGPSTPFSSRLNSGRAAPQAKSWDSILTSWLSSSQGIRAAGKRPWAPSESTSRHSCCCPGSHCISHPAAPASHLVPGHACCVQPLPTRQPGSLEGRQWSKQ